MKSQNTVLYILGLKPRKVGGVELFCQAFAKRLLAIGWRVVFCCEESPAEPVREALSFPNVVWEVIPVQAGLSPKRAAECARLILRYRPSTVIYTLNGVLRPYPWVAKLLGVRRVFYKDGTSRLLPPRRRNFLKVAVGRLVTFPLSGSICVTDYVRRCELAERFIAPQRVETVYNGIDLSGVAAAAGSGRRFRELYGIAPHKKVILQMSWMVPAKGVDKLLRAARMVLDAMPDAHFVLAGEGPHRPVYEALSEELGIAKAITWTGMIKHPIAEGVFDAADICCLFSQWQEAFGLVVIEAMAFGVPVITSNTGGLPELVVDGHTGYVVDKDDVAALADRILKLLADSELRSRLGGNAKACVAKKFDLTRTVDAYVERLIGGSTHRPRSHENAQLPVDTGRDGSVFRR
jgi:glycosyltransferase involved in cell wall biosynthesis